MGALMNPAQSTSDSSDLIKLLRDKDLTIEDELLHRILQSGDDIVPELAEIIEQTIKQSHNVNLAIPHKGTGWCTVIHALNLLAHLRAEHTLDLVLELLALDQEVLEYWWHDLINDDLWEIVFYLGRDQIDELDEFVMNDANNQFSRLSVCTALVQIALHYPARYDGVVSVFKRLLRTNHRDCDFVGLVINELLDLCEPGLKPFMLDNLERYRIWYGIINATQVEDWYRRMVPRRRVPLDLFERYAYYRQHPYFASTASPHDIDMDAILRQVHKSQT